MRESHTLFLVVAIRPAFFEYRDDVRCDPQDQPQKGLIHRVDREIVMGVLPHSDNSTCCLSYVLWHCGRLELVVLSKMAQPDPVDARI